MLAVGLGALRLMRRRSASARHWMLGVTIACAAGLPLLQPVAPSWGWHRSPLQRAAAPEHPPAAAAEAPFARIQIAGTRARPRSDGSPAIIPRLLVWLARIQWTGAAVFVFVLVVGLVRLERIAAQAVPVSSPRIAGAARSLERALGIPRPVRLLR